MDQVFGLGDIELKGVLSPSAKGPGFKWGVGPSVVLPTATDTRLGNGKWQLGGAMTALYTNEKWSGRPFPEQFPALPRLEELEGLALAGPGRVTCKQCGVPTSAA